MNKKTKNKFESSIRMQYQDVILFIIRAIDYHNQQAMTDFSNHEFHQKQATILKLYLIDIKEFITEQENNE